MRQNTLIFVSVLLFAGLPGCMSLHTSNTSDSVKKATTLAANNGFVKKEIKTNPFILTSFQKFARPNNTLTIYIEGDGRTWITRTKLSVNPTPRNPLALKLAILDKSPNVAYLARPCQYTPFEFDLACQPSVWSFDRFSKPVIQAMNEAVDILKKEAKATKIHLVGFSGGAAIAALIAANRTDVATLKTVAGDLNHQALSKYHKTTPLQNALNPMDVAHKIKDISQQHFVGENDTVVPPFIAEDFVNEIIKNGGHHAKRIVIKDATHQKGWETAWERLLNKH